MAQLLAAGRQAPRTGIWHETYLVRNGEYETIYGNMPPFGLGKAGNVVQMPSRRRRVAVSKATAGRAPSA